MSNAIDRLRNVIRRQHKALSTESSYVYWLRQYVTALKSMPSSLPSEQKLDNLLTHLARGRDLSASTQNLAFNAILFNAELGITSTFTTKSCAGPCKTLMPSAPDARPACAMPPPSSKPKPSSKPFGTGRVIPRAQNSAFPNGLVFVRVGDYGGLKCRAL